MTYTLFDLTYRTARELGIVLESVATGGSTTTLIDTVFLTQGDDYWNKGTVWVLYDAAGAGAAPEGQYGVVSDFSDTNDTATLTVALSAAIAASDRYAIGKKRYPLHILIQNVNKAIQELGPVLPIATSDIVTTELESEYSVPTAPTGTTYDLKRVFLHKLWDADTLGDEPWVELKNWYVQTTTAGVPATILFPYDLPAGYVVKCVYCIAHPELHVYSDVMSATIPVEYVVYAAAANCLNWYRQKTRTNNRSIVDDIAYYRQKAMEYKMIQPVLFRKEEEMPDDYNVA